MNEFINELKTLPNKIESIQKQLFDIAKGRASMDKKISIKENAIKSDINNEVDSNGKKVYSNESARKIAFEQELTKNKELKTLHNEYDMLLNRKALLDIDLEVARNTQSNYKAILNFMGSVGDKFGTSM